MSKAMKMTDEDFQTLSNALDESPYDWIEKAAEYAKLNLSPKRFRWDALYAVRLIAGSSTAPTGWDVYDYLDDTHIDTALRSYFKDIGCDWAAQT